MTHKYKKLAHLFLFISLFITTFPILFYFIKAFVTGNTTQKVSMGMIAMAALIIVIVNMLFKSHLKCVIWLLLIGIYICLNNILPLLIMVSIGSILDEIVITPLYKSFKNKYKINKEIDKRL